MVALISIGIESVNSGMEDIPCAYNDAIKVFDIFERTFENNLKKNASICVRNVTSIECRAIISALSLVMDSEDIVIFYFSGHGKKSANGKLQLVFSDYQCEDKKGIIFLEEIVLDLKKYNCPILVILDCCYSGAGLAESIQDDYRMESNVSIMTSNGPAGREIIDNKGSQFTKAVCKALLQIMDNESRVTIKNIFSYTKKNNPNSKVFIGGGNADVVLGENERLEYPENFSDVLIDKVEHKNYEMREALWYSVGYLPEKIRIDILEKYLGKNQNSCMELSWRVRRAIGSVYKYGRSEKVDNYIMKLIQSERWTDKCIGYICARKSNENCITDAMCKDLKDFKKCYPMDLVWLLVLYLSDRENADFSVVSDTKLMKTGWGVMEIWKRYLNDIEIEKKMECFREKIDENVYNQLCLELFLNGKLHNCEMIPSKIKDDVMFIKELYKCKKRGRTPESNNNKWMFSVLYGNWRDQVDINSILEKRWKNERDKDKFIKMLQYIPSIEIKMAILGYFSRIARNNRYELNVDSLKWGLKDQHPWVVRSALPIFQGKMDEYKDCIRKNIDMQIYPGVFDLAIELSKQGSGFEYQISKINGFEKEMLKVATECERTA